MEMCKELGSRVKPRVSYSVVELFREFCVQRVKLGISLLSHIVAVTTCSTTFHHIHGKYCFQCGSSMMLNVPHQSSTQGLGINDLDLTCAESESG